MTPVTPRYLNQALAAAYLGVSVTTFKEIVQPELEALRVVVHVGRAVRFDLEDLDAWAKRHKGTPAAGRSGGKKGRPSGSSASATKADDTRSRRVKQIEQLLEAKPRASTPRLFPVA